MVALRIHHNWFLFLLVYSVVSKNKICSGGELPFINKQLVFPVRANYLVLVVSS